MLSERDRRELAAIERRLEHDDPVLAQRMAKQPAKPRRGPLLWWPVLSMLVLCAGLLGQDSLLILLALAGFVVAGVLAALRLCECRGDDDPGHGGWWPRCTL